MKAKGIRSSLSLRGTVERRLFDTAKLAHVKKLVELGASREQVEELLDWASKPMFKGNVLWKILHRVLDVDVQLPFVTGYWTKRAIESNLVPTRGKEIVADQVGGTETTPVTAVAIGTGTTAAAAGDTALETEITTNGGERGAASVSNTTTTTTNDTEQWQKTFNFTGSFAVTEEGLLDNNVSGGNLLARQVFSAINVANGDSLQITHKVQVT